ncbi:unnamed protein product [Schistosoma rodhaini]|uniref:Uncharacterized protein n=1 Tax=Schistosoma rodhaini TaxID=6188 RepID=A0AA85FYN5_9TREM|nr:unnamed protein product [Schistosoma rodhaini]
MLHKYPNEGSHTYNDRIKYNDQIVICKDSKLSGMIDPVRIRFILKVEISCKYKFQNIGVSNQYPSNLSMNIHYCIGVHKF